MRIIHNLLNKRFCDIVCFARKDRFFYIYHLAKERIPIILRLHELKNILNCIDSTKYLKGNIAEVGVLHGGTANFIRESMLFCDKLYLFDTFEGIEGCEFQEQWSEANFNKVVSKFKDFDSVIINKGMFPKDFKKDYSRMKFKFVHLDVDLVRSTYDSLEFLYPRMVKGGIILIHDYKIKNGNDTESKYATDTFCDENKLNILKMAGTHAAIIKMED
ncbi:MAG: hypothetical protein H8E98_08295 [Bacteroidetes bacterium]|nr:hypothetical protein [Bacteroidota bacterium]